MHAETPAIAQLPVVRRLLASPNPSVVFKTRVDVLGEAVDSPRVRSIREQVRTSHMVRRLLHHRQPDGTIATNPYKKWQGPHWTLMFLAEIGYPSSDRSLMPMREQFYDWLFSKEHLRFPRSLLIPGQEDRFRRCASQEAYAVWYSLKLGLEDERTDELVRRLKGWRWPDGGWNCDKRPEARISSFHETVIPIRALSLYGRMKGDRESLAVARTAAELFLKRRLYRRQRDGEIIHPSFTLLQYPHFPIYNILLGLRAMAEAGCADDVRCGDALGLLESKRLADGGFPLEKRNHRTVESPDTRGTFADWGPGGRRRPNDFVTVEALHVLKEAGRLRPQA